MENGKKSAFATSSPSCANYAGHLQEGLTKREYFAGLSMQSYVTSSHIRDDFDRRKIADWAVKMADELLKRLDE